MEIKYRIIFINGDYATAESLSSGERTDIALALLPPETDEDSVIIFKDFEYCLVK